MIYEGLNGKFLIDADNKLIIISESIGVLEFYREIMKMVHEPYFMDYDVPIEEINYVISPNNGWVIKNYNLLKDENILVQFKNEKD